MAAQCFLPLVRETKDWRLTEYQPTQLIILLGEQQALHFREWLISPQPSITALNFPARLVIAPAVTLISPPSPGLLLISSSTNSCYPRPVAKPSTSARDGKATPIRRAIDARHDWAALREKALNFGEAEQALLVGHAFHPAPKSHEPFNQQEAERYLLTARPTSRCGGLR